MVPGSPPSSSARARRFRADTSSPAYRAMADAMAEAYPGETMRYATAGAAPSPLCSLRSPAPLPASGILLIGLSEPEAQIHAVSRRVPREAQGGSRSPRSVLRNYAAG